MIGFTHEENPRVDLTQLNFSILEKADEVIDLLNNLIGQKIGNMFRGATNKMLVGAVLEEFYSNGMWVVTEIEGGFTISRQRLTDDQFNSAFDYLNNMLNEYGREYRW